RGRSPAVTAHASGPSTPEPANRSWVYQIRNTPVPKGYHLLRLASDPILTILRPYIIAPLDSGMKERLPVDIGTHARRLVHDPLFKRVAVEELTRMLYILAAFEYVLDHEVDAGMKLQLGREVCLVGTREGMVERYGIDKATADSLTKSWNEKRNEETAGVELELWARRKRGKWGRDGCAVCGCEAPRE
ncbi:hypothetical protein P7C73_g4521, partial [Tremellales sp. Uapishka_1]